jgi:NADH-quinone oxidoreductase subunit F
MTAASLPVVDSSNPRIVSTRLAVSEGHTIERYMSDGGYRALRATVTQMTPDDVQREVQLSGLTGRSGGAAFPTAAKWGLLLDRYPRYLVVNGDESEPGIFKDRALMEADPHQLIEGALLCAYAIGAHHIFIYIRGEMALAQERVITALNDAYELGAWGPAIFDSSFRCEISVNAGAGAYIVGEETALIESLEGKRGMPRIKPPDFPATRGLYGYPTIVNNVETLSTLPWIIANGGASYAQLGGGRYRGTRLFSVSGQIRKPGIYEVELYKNTFRDLLFSEAFAGGLRPGRQLRAFLPGPSFPWLFPEQLDLRLDGDAVASNGSSLGPGIIVLDSTSCPVRVASRLVRFYAHESCGKCTPCREGTTWMASIMGRIEAGCGRIEDIDLLLDVGAGISPPPFPHAPDPSTGTPAVPFPYKQTTICPLGPSAVSPVHSSIFRFRDDYLSHIRHGRCVY